MQSSRRAARPSTPSPPGGQAQLTSDSGGDSQMRSVHEEPVQVARSGDTPEQFLLHGRLHVVRAVLARWTEPGGWRWSGPGRMVPVAVPAGAAAAGTGAGAGGIATPVIHSVPVDLADRELWRVEAAAGRSARPQVFDLCRDTAAAPPAPPRWTATLVEE